jgi:hypothetical protein
VDVAARRVDLPTGSIDCRATGPTDLASARVKGVFPSSSVGERGTARAAGCQPPLVVRRAQFGDRRRSYDVATAVAAQRSPAGVGGRTFVRGIAVVSADGRWRLHVSDSGSVEQRPRASTSSLVGHSGTARSGTCP